MDLKAAQAPIKEHYHAEPGEARITLRARANETDAPVACSVEAGQAIQAAQAHVGVGGPGTAACSGDLLLGALAACAQVTCQMVAASMGLQTERIEVIVEGDLDLRGTLGVSRDAKVGFEAIRLSFEVEAPGATAEELASLERKTERYCTVFQTLQDPPPVETRLASQRG
jgi:uncharacterized OsmC-like protein